MKMVSAVICGQQMIGRFRITDDGVKVDKRIKVPCSANPGVDGLPVCLA
jgi:hypothetical protein